MSLSVSDYIYTGTIRHRRFVPFDHFFSYRIFMVYFDISKVEQILKKSWFWNVNKPSIVSFYREDYHGNQEQSLDDAVRSTIYQKTGRILKGPIRILTHLRYFGYCFNPVSFYYCFDQSDQNVELIMAEITNTPWKERHSYIVSDKRNSKSNLTTSFGKDFHVSPFWGMDHQYEWIFTKPEKNLVVNMKNIKDQNKVFDATLTLERKAFNLKNLVLQTLSLPFMTVRIVFRIHWQALKLWIKGAHVFDHPNEIKVKVEDP